LNLFSRQFIAGLFVLLFLIGQFASLAHAVEHPFHQADDYCTVFSHYEKYDLASDFSTCYLQFSALTSENSFFSQPSVYSRFTPAYSSRAPPFTS
jgi:hypothetical protein